MRILFANTPVYDYLTATLIEGLQELGHELRCTEASNYGEKIADEEAAAYAEAADLIIVGSNAGVRHDFLRDVRNPRRVFVDGGDSHEFAVASRLQFKAVFKRELGRRDDGAAAAFVFPLPFAAERRYFGPAIERDLLVSFVANMSTNPLRHSVHRRLLNKRHPNIFSGGTNERAYAPTAPRGLPIETPAYRKILARSHISVNVPGAGYDCARYWEIMAAGSLLFTYKPDIVIPHEPVDGVSCVTFASLDEFDDKLEYYLDRPDLVRRIAAAGHELVTRFHTTRERAAQFLDVATELVGRDGYCAQFLHPELRVLEPLCRGRGLDLSPDGRTTPDCGRGDPGTAEALDFIVARHPAAPDAMAGWGRTLRPGGRVGVVLRNDGWTASAVAERSGLALVESGDAMPGHSSYAILERRELTMTTPVWQQLSAGRDAHAHYVAKDYAPVHLLDVARHAPRVVLDVGCYCGAMGAQIKQRFPQSRVIGVEPRAQAAEMARARLDHVQCATLEQFDHATAGLAHGSIDTVILADVLEHMYDPWAALLALRPWLSSHAQLLISIPNARNLWLLQHMAAGRFDYESSGLLDITHIRFFTRPTIQAMFAQTGYATQAIHGLPDDRCRWILEDLTVRQTGELKAGNLSLSGLEPNDVTELAVLQFYFCAVPA